MHPGDWLLAAVLISQVMGCGAVLSCRFGVSFAEDLGAGDVWNWVENEIHPFPQSLALALERPLPTLNLALTILNLSCPPILGTLFTLLIWQNKKYLLTMVWDNPWDQCWNLLELLSLLELLTLPCLASWVFSTAPTSFPSLRCLSSFLQPTLPFSMNYKYSWTHISTHLAFCYQ